VLGDHLDDRGSIASHLVLAVLADEEGILGLDDDNTRFALLVVGVG